MLRLVTLRIRCCDGGGGLGGFQRTERFLSCLRCEATEVKTPTQGVLLPRLTFYDRSCTQNLCPESGKVVQDLGTD